MSNQNETTTTESAPESTPANKGGRNNGFPFASKKEIAERLAVSVDFQIECLKIVVGRQTDDELEEKATKYTNKSGLRCSEAVFFPALLAKLQNEPESVTAAEYERLDATIPKYRKQLALHFRAEALASNPELAVAAAKFGL